MSNAMQRVARFHKIIVKDRDALALKVTALEEANRKLFAALWNITRKAYKRPGNHEDYHVHPDLIVAAVKILNETGGVR
jgi:hypothetical protein